MVAQLLLKLRYNDAAVLKKLRDLLGGREAMSLSPLYQEIVDEAKLEGATETRRKDILRILRRRLGDEARDLRIELDAVESDRLEELIDQAVICPRLADFRERLLS